MSKIKIKFTEDHIKLIRQFYIGSHDELQDVKDKINELNNESFDVETMIKYAIKSDQSMLGQSLNSISTSDIDKTKKNYIQSNIETVSDNLSSYEENIKIVTKKIKDIADVSKNIEVEKICGVDTYSLWGGDYFKEQIAYILDKTDKAIDYGEFNGTEGPRYDEETEKYFSELSDFFSENLNNIEELLHQFCFEGIHPNVTYWCYDYNHIWKKEE